MSTTKNYVLPQKIDGNYVLEGEDSVQIIGPKIAFHTKNPIVQQTIGAYAPEALEAYVDGTAGLDSAANMEALYDTVVELITKVQEIHTILKNIGLAK
jgi:hypothetical protein